MSGRIVFHGLPTANPDSDGPIAAPIASPTLTEETPLFTAERAAAEAAAEATAASEAAPAESSDPAAAAVEEKYSGEADTSDKEIRISFAPVDEHAAAAAAPEAGAGAESDAAAPADAVQSSDAKIDEAPQAEAEPAAEAAPAADAAAEAKPEEAKADTPELSEEEKAAAEKRAKKEEKERLKAEKKEKEAAEKAKKEEEEKANGAVAPVDGVVVHVDRDGNDNREGDKNSVQHALLMLRNQRQQIERIKTRVNWCAIVSIVLVIFTGLAFAVALFYLSEEPDYLKSGSVDTASLNSRITALSTRTTNIENSVASSSLLAQVNSTASRALMQSAPLWGITPGLAVTANSVTVETDGTTITLDGSSKLSVKAGGIGLSQLESSLSTLSSNLLATTAFTTTDTQIGPVSTGGSVTVGSTLGSVTLSALGNSLTVGNSVTVSSISSVDVNAATSITHSAPTVNVRSSSDSNRGLFVSSSGTTVRGTSSSSLSLSSSDNSATLSASKLTIAAPIQRAATSVASSSISNIDFSALPSSTLRVTGNPGAAVPITVSNCNTAAIGSSITLINAMTASSDIITMSKATCSNQLSVSLRPGDYITLTCITPNGGADQVQCEKPSQALAFGGFKANVASANLTLDYDGFTGTINSVRLDAPAGILELRPDADNWQSGVTNMAIKLDNTFITPASSALLITNVNQPYSWASLMKQEIADGSVMLRFVTLQDYARADFDQYGPFKVAFMVL